MRGRERGREKEKCFGYNFSVVVISNGNEQRGSGKNVTKKSERGRERSVFFVLFLKMF